VASVHVPPAPSMAGNRSERGMAHGTEVHDWQERVVMDDPDHCEDGAEGGGKARVALRVALHCARMAEEEGGWLSETEGRLAHPKMPAQAVEGMIGFEENAAAIAVARAGQTLPSPVLPRLQCHELSSSDISGTSTKATRPLLYECLGVSG
jgi:hypothetical protein